ncbi:type IX secretion system motor protein PorM/GldM [Portibacter marinus]|uniref:type IX secretion system motor protein PorM/GldM n=1 Tax=Portibacter marinus TaxID=2898660 RepID=UPI001F2781BC|nr:GldM family protein [Portibacter marinus]
MSIPKEPRQLMINIMYLVLTAMLALNVSAEIFNAFKIVDKGLIKSNAALEQSNDAIIPAIQDGAKKKESLAQYAERIEPARELSNNMEAQIEQLMEDMIAATNGWVEDKETGAQTDDLKGKKNMDITTRYLVEEGNGAKLKQALIDYKDEIMQLVDEEDRSEFEKNVAVTIDDQTWREKGKASWSHMNFDHMPLQATLPIFRKFQNDVKSTESAFLNYLAGKVGTTTDVVLDKFTVVSAPEKSYVIKGEKFKTDVFLSAFAGADSKTGISISVNGKALPVNSEGIATFEQTASSVGIKKFDAVASIRNPVTDEVQTFRKTFEYEVGERSVSVSASKMNVFYIGVDNPVEVSAAGVPSGQIQVSAGGAGGPKIKKNGDGTYTVNVSRPTAKGEFAEIRVSAPGLNATKDFRVKRIPDPIAKLSGKSGGTMGAGPFKAQIGVYGDLQNFDFDAKCNIAGYRVVRVAKRQDPEFSTNPGSNYTAQTQAIIAKAKPGDTYYFENVKCKCPGDPAQRELNTMVFNIN